MSGDAFEHTDGCPFCGEPHPAEESQDFGDLPGCEHYVGRYDGDGHPGSDEYPRLDGGLRFLERMSFARYAGAQEPTEAALAEAFGADLPLAESTYPDGFMEAGDAAELFLAVDVPMVDRTITGSMVWSCSEYYAADAEAALAEIRRASEAIVQGMARLNGSAG